MRVCIFVYRRDLRVIDNVGLNHAMAYYDRVIPIFIFNPAQIKSNKYGSAAAIKFMMESLTELNSDLKRVGSRLHCFNGDDTTVLTRLLRDGGIDAVVFNRDYTPFARKRDGLIASVCDRANVDCVECEDYLLSAMGELNKADGTPYTVFTPFKNNALKYPPPKPQRTRLRNLGVIRGASFALPRDYIGARTTLDTAVKGGRTEGIKQLRKLSAHRQYKHVRDCVSIQTTQLSAFIKFGCVSIREVYWRIRTLFGVSSTLMSQLYWREFYYYIVSEFPYVLGRNWSPKYDKIKWRWSQAQFKRWCDGTTGYPIVDAGMRELNQSHIMHNRARLITANFLNRMLGMDWRRGEQYFAVLLVDYDPAVNNGNWQWIASTGVDPKPYFQRLFNPWTQSAKFDPDATYIKKWIPSLKNVPAEHLHQWDKYHGEYNLEKLDYVAPIVDYADARKRSIEMYRAVLR